jgi:hypothetical protein
MVEYFLLSIKKMNMTVMCFSSTQGFSCEAATTEGTKLRAGIADDLIGIVTLIPIVLPGITEPPLPYISGAVKCFVHCPNPISRVDSFLTVSMHLSG